MNNKMVRRALVLAALLMITVLAGATDLRTLAVFDMQKVILSFYQDSALYRDYELGLEQYRADKLRIEDSIADYQRRRSTALDRNDSRTAQTLRETIRGLEEDLLTVKEVWAVQSDEYLRKLTGDEFFTQLYAVVGYLAEDMGYTLVLNMNVPGLGIFWVSDAIDITDEVIQELLIQYR